ncbi:MAG: hypothetical protein C0425_09655 [Chlorobiaceae bacterium]|nr:hypothetical protein [Chlorobiaceae bacterium]MBA4310582.1 hypothetical protein [Chlorobiaceae bacterium]
MSVDKFISLRYLFSKHKLNFITIISYLSITGITIGVAALIIVLSVFNGFSSLITSYLVNFDPHLRIEINADADKTTVKNLENILSNEKRVIGFSNFVEGKVLLVSENKTQVVNLKGIEEVKSFNVYGFEENVILGEFDLSDENTPSVIIGLQLADRMHLSIDDTLMIVSPAGIERAIINLSIPSNQRFVVKGIFQSNNNDYDAGYIFSSIKSSQILFNQRNNIDGIDVRFDNINFADQFKNELLKTSGENEFRIYTWYDLHRELFTIMEIERWVAYIILCLIIAVAVFNILSSLSMSVIEKKRDLGILQAMGMEQNQIKKIFINQGLIVGLVGTLVGFALGIFVYWLQITYKIYPLNPLQYKIDALPMELRLFDFIAVGLASITLSFLASFYPAKKAVTINPIDAIKWE